MAFDLAGKGMGLSIMVSKTFFGKNSRDTMPISPLQIRYQVPRISQFQMLQIQNTQALVTGFLILFRVSDLGFRISLQPFLFESIHILIHDPLADTGYTS